VKALVTGFTGQDGTLLTHDLLSRGIQVVALVRRVSTEPPVRVRGGYDFAEQIRTGQLTLVPGDLGSLPSLIDCLRTHRPGQVYNLAAQSHVGTSFGQPDLTAVTDYMGLLNLTTAMDATGCEARLYQASSSEMYGNGHRGPLNEDSPFNPNSPYAIAKTAAHFHVRALRERGRFASAGILFNHESEIRGGDFVTQKIARCAATGERLRLGNLDARRDWGHASDYVRAMHLILSNDEPGEFVIGTGQSRSVREFVDAAYEYAGRPLTWASPTQAWSCGHLAVTHDPAMVRPLDIDCLEADPSRAHRVLGWKPEVSFEELVARMVDNQRTPR
jgi:GDPmannose 4,6-dehydratase